MLIVKKNFKLLILFFVLTFSSCNLFRYGIKERENEKKEHSGFESKNKKERLATAELVIQQAKKYEGAPYKLGGETKQGIDCSALVMLSYKNAGISLPRTSMEQSKIGETVALKDALPGDLIFFKFKKSKSSNPVNHVGIITKVDKNGMVYFYHASNSLGVIESSLAETYYRDVFVKIMRVY